MQYRLNGTELNSRRTKYQITWCYRYLAIACYLGILLTLLEFEISLNDPFFSSKSGTIISNLFRINNQIYRITCFFNINPRKKNICLSVFVFNAKFVHKRCTTWAGVILILRISQPFSSWVVDLELYQQTKSLFEHLNGWNSNQITNCFCGIRISRKRTRLKKMSMKFWNSSWMPK